MNEKDLRNGIKNVMKTYKSGFEHYSIVWGNYHTSSKRHLPEWKIRNELEFMRRLDFGVIASGSKGIHRVFYARSGN